MITAEIKLNNDYYTQVQGRTIEEVIEKIKDYHTMGLYERDYFEIKGRLQKELDTGWWLNGR